MTRLAPEPEVTRALESACRALPEAQVLRFEGAYAFGPSLRVDGFRLPNGFTLWVQRDRTAPVASVQTWVRVGSRVEEEGRTGLSHLFEHLMFGGTPAHPEGDIDRLYEEAGVESNAATFLDWTSYHATLPKAALGLCLELEADRFQNLVLGEAELEREREVVLNERRERVDDDVEGAASERLYTEAFRVHGYGIPTIGHARDLESLCLADCQRFYEAHYSAANAELVVVGDVELEELFVAVARLYGALPARRVPPAPDRPEPEQTAERRAALEVETQTVKLAIGYRAPALGEPAHAAATLLGEIAFGGAGSRLHRALVRRLGIAADVRGWVGTFREPGLIDLWVAGREGVKEAELLRAVDEVLGALAGAEPPTSDELARAKARFELATLQGLETVHGRAEALGFHAVVMDAPAGVLDRLELARRVDLAELAEAARVLFARERRTVVAVRPKGAG